MIGQEDNALAKHVIDRRSELQKHWSQRSPELNAIAQIYRPERQGFTGQGKNDLNLHKQFSSAGLVAAGNATASLYSTLSNPANRWLEASSGDDDLDKFDTVAAWNDIVSRRMLASFGASMSNYYNSAVSWVGDVVALGSGVMVSDAAQGKRRFRDTCVCLTDCVFGTDSWGEVNELIVVRRLTAVNAAREFGVKTLPEKLRDKAANGDNSDTFEFLQAIQINDDFTPNMFGVKGKPWVSTHVSVEGCTVVKQGGMTEQSFAVPRWMTDGQSALGRGLGYLNLAAGLKLQAQERDNLQAGALAARPPLATIGTKAMRNMAQLSPGKFLHGGMLPNGTQGVKPVFTHQGMPVTLEMVNSTKDEIENGWHAALLSLVGRTGLGNLEVIERQEERLRLQAPFMGRLQTEGLTPLLERRFALLWRAGQIPPPPPELKGRPLVMKFTSVAARAQRAEEGVATARLLEDTYKLAERHPDPQQVWDNVDIDGAYDVLAEARGVPRRALRTDKEIEKLRADRAKEAEAANAMATAAQGASIGKDMAAAAPAMDQLAGMMQ